MVRYNFKRIQKVPNAEELKNIVLSSVQTKTPTIIHPQFHISRIRSFYIRKVKFVQMDLNDRITKILKDFPRLEDIHPFFSHLINILYDKDHYKLALGQLNRCRHLTNKIGRDYIQFLKYGDSAYRCKKLKISGIGRMMTLIKKLNGLEYLEKVRQHLSRLPQIDPSGRSLLLTGFPNVGKSSFINKITKAKVDVQDYPFTTQSLFVGHFDYKDLTWQVIDSPGILDHALTDRNTIEMQSINALAHLEATVLFMIDVSESVYSIEKQIGLFNSLKPLFRNKPVMIVCTKIDIVSMSELSDEKKKIISDIRTLENNQVPIFGISNLSGDGINHVKESACNVLLKDRVNKKVSSTGNRSNAFADNILRKLYVSMPEKRDDINRPPVVVRRKEKRPKKVLEIDKERELGYGVYQYDHTKDYKLKNDEWNSDNIPEIMDGKNILDFYDENVEVKLDELRNEEMERIENLEKIDFDSEEYKIDSEISKMFDEIEGAKKDLKLSSKMSKSMNHAKLPRKYRKVKMSEIKSGLLKRGVDENVLENVKQESQKMEARGRSKSRVRSQAKRLGNPKISGPSINRSVSQVRNMENSRMRVERSQSILGKRNREIGMGGNTQFTDRSLSSIGKFGGFSDTDELIGAVRLGHKKRKIFNKSAKKNFGERSVVYNFKPKHLFTGKASFKRDRR